MVQTQFQRDKNVSSSSFWLYPFTGLPSSVRTAVHSPTSVYQTSIFHTFLRNPFSFILSVWPYHLNALFSRFNIPNEIIPIPARIVFFPFLLETLTNHIQSSYFTPEFFAQWPHFDSILNNVLYYDVKHILSSFPSICLHHIKFYVNAFVSVFPHGASLN